MLFKPEFQAMSLKFLIKENDEIKKGQTIMILEAMKMEIEVQAQKDGIIEQICVGVGDAVSESDAIAIYKE